MLPDKGEFFGQMQNSETASAEESPEGYSDKDMSENASRQGGILRADAEL